MSAAASPRLHHHGAMSGMPAILRMLAAVGVRVRVAGGKIVTSGAVNAEARVALETLQGREGALAKALALLPDFARDFEVSGATAAAVPEESAPEAATPRPRPRRVCRPKARCSHGHDLTIPGAVLPPRGNGTECRKCRCARVQKAKARAALRRDMLSSGSTVPE